MSTPQSRLSPLPSLQRQAGRINRQIERRQRRSAWYATLRLAVFGGGVAASLIAFFSVGARLFGLLLAATVVIFAILVYLHGQVEGSRRRFTRYGQLINQQIARLGPDWRALPAARIANPRFDHPFEADLDLVGERSLHRLLDVAVSAQGSAQLRDWLTESQPDLAATVQRQALVGELIPLHLLRYQIAIDGSQVVANDNGWQADRLSAWLAQPRPTTRLGWWVAGLAGLALVNLLLFAASTWWGLPPVWRYSLSLYAVLYLLHGRAITGAFFEASNLRDDLQQLLAVFRHLERFGFPRSPELRLLCLPFHEPTRRPSQLLRQVVRVVDATGLQGNPIIALVINAVAPWGLFFVWQLEKQKTLLAERVPVWLARWYQLEALSSLANAAYLQPEATFPVLRAATEPPVFAVSGLGHPLLPSERKVRNDFRFTGLGELALLTGSNMSGKSTFLRALGVSLALANAGGVVDAVRLETTLFRLFTCIKVSDSVTDGISYFYAEVRRLKLLLTALAAPQAAPLFFCIDEIFRGTNNRGERLLGSRAYILALLQQHGVGLIATHDLDLVKLADESALIRNYHFRDTFANGQMQFDFRLRPGRSPTTNALQIMRSAGLPVPDPVGEEDTYDRNGVDG